MKKIKLTQGKVALVDDEDFEELSQSKWYAHKNRNIYYAVRTYPSIDGKQHTIHMHRVILKTPAGLQTDHSNGDGLDNRKENLRVATRSENQWNTQKRINNTSGCKGVTWNKKNQRWIAKIMKENKSYYLGSFKKKEDAALAYNLKATELFKEFAKLK